MIPNCRGCKAEFEMAIMEQDVDGATIIPINLGSRGHFCYDIT